MKNFQKLEDIWSLPHIEIAEELLTRLNPYINIKPNFDPYDFTEENGNNLITFDSVAKNAGLSEKTRFAIVSHYLDYPSNLHHHDYIEMIYIPKGRILNVVEHIPYIMKENSLCIIDQNTSHFVAQLPNENEKPLIINILIHPDLVQSLNFDYIEKELNLKNIFEHENHLLLQKEEVLSLNQELHRLILSYYNSDYRLTYSTLGQLTIFLDQLGNHYVRTLIRYDELTQRCLELIKMNPASVSLGALSKKLSYSQGYLSRHIKQQTRKTVSQLIAEEKLYLAEKYLSESDLTISHIVNLLGYQSESHFYKSFKQKFHLTPRQYRKILAPN